MTRQSSPPQPETDGALPTLVQVFRQWLMVPGGERVVEAKREIQASALRRLEALDRVHREVVEQAREVVAGAWRDLQLHDVTMHAAKIRGREYYLYQRATALFFSILEPEEYHQADHAVVYLAAYRLNEDSSWSRVDGDGAEPWLAALPRRP